MVPLFDAVRGLRGEAVLPVASEPRDPPGTEARAGLKTLLGSGLVGPLNGPSVMDALDAESGCGLLDRLIADDYLRADLTTLTLDRRMGALVGVERL